MNRLVMAVAMTLALLPSAYAQEAAPWPDPAADTQGVDNSSPVDRQADETYRKNALPPVPAAPLPRDRPADMRPKIITGSADRQHAQTYRKNALVPVPATQHATPASLRYPPPLHRHRARHRRHVVIDPVIVEPTSTSITIPPHD